MGYFKCYKFECEKDKTLATIQVYFNKANEMKYGRARHYLKMADGKPTFSYCVQSKEYLEEKLKNLSNTKNSFSNNTNSSGLGQINVNLEHNNVNLEKLESSSKSKMVGLERFELSSITPEATSLDQASRQPHRNLVWFF